MCARDARSRDSLGRYECEIRYMRAMSAGGTQRECRNQAPDGSLFEERERHKVNALLHLMGTTRKAHMHSCTRGHRKRSATAPADYDCGSVGRHCMWYCGRVGKPSTRGSRIKASPMGHTVTAMHAIAVFGVWPHVYVAQTRGLLAWRLAGSP